MRPLAVGIQLPEVERVVRWPELAAMVREIEDLGFDSIWVGDHLLYDTPEGRSGPWEAWTQLAAIAAVTERVTIGPLVASTGFHAPAMLAKQAATVDEISAGRLVLGLGAGWNRVEYDAFGFPFDHRASRFVESFEVIRRLLAGERVDMDGRYVTVRGAELLPPPRPGGPPLMVGSIGPRVLGATLGHVAMWNAWFSWYGNTASGIADLRLDVAAEARRVGRDAEEIEYTAAVLVALPGAVGRNSHDHDDRSVVPLAGERPGAVADELRRFAEAGIGHVQLVVDPITVESIRRLSDVLVLLDRG